MDLTGVPWILLALLAMACFSISAVLLKVIVGDYGLPRVLEDLRHANLSPPIQYGLVWALISTVGLALFLSALATGKVALVNAVASLSTVLIALLSYVFLGDRFSAREVVAIALAAASVIVLAL